MRASTFARPFVIALVGASMLLAACGKDSTDTTALAETTVATESSAPGTDAVETSTAGTEVASETTAAALGTLAEAATPAEEDLAGPLVMTSDGIGPFKLGQKADGVIAGLTAIFGPPVEDTGWAASEAPCEGMGSRSRYVSWGRLGANFADGPTATVNAPGEHFSSYSVFGDFGDTPSLDRFVFDDGQQALGRDENELRTWNPAVEFFNSEIEGPVWSVGKGLDQWGGAFETPQGSKAPRVQSVRAGLFCID